MREHLPFYGKIMIGTMLGGLAFAMLLQTSSDSFIVELWGRLYASSAHMNSVLIFDLKGTRLGSLMPKPPDKLEGPSALALIDRKLYVLNMATNHVSVIDL